VELEAVESPHAQPPVTRVPPLDNAEPAIELESGVQDLFAQPSIASKSASYGGDEVEPQRQFFKTSLLSLQGGVGYKVTCRWTPPTQMNITGPEHTVWLSEVDMASLLAYPDTKQQSRYTASRGQSVSDTDDDAMSMDVDRRRGN
jgi:hypothetical protein